eukprot:TRINITY_DN1514_c0_g1_i1.p1 TRINITY_DN1514_c0_g1~~TRINITY_DN1514_c0_g1_i1.p1  ORF type:complete len:696 (-),score=186.21 TRINITY_DN1514_c0_g1_i1:27-2114(-)
MLAPLAFFAGAGLYHALMRRVEQHAQFERNHPSQEAPAEDTLLWKPSAERANASIMAAFMKIINQKYKLSLDSYQALWRWSTTHTAEFWGEVWDFTAVIHSSPPTRVLEPGAAMFPVPKWFEGAKLNFAENLLRYNDDHVALIACTEQSTATRSVTYAQLRIEVARTVASLRALGVKRGDRVAGYIPNCIEAVVAMLATTAIGAIWTSTSPDFGVKGVLERFAQVQPVVLFSVNAVFYNGKVHDHTAKLIEVVSGLESLVRVVVIPFVAEAPLNLKKVRLGISLNDFYKLGAAVPTPALTFEQVPFDHPVFILYSSGTTGLPKCMVHGVGGTLLQHLKEHQLHTNIRRDDVFFYFTTTGWMMWNWLVSGLSSGCAVVLYDGSPFMPTPLALFDIADNLGVTIFGTSAKYISSLEAAGVAPRETHKLTTIHTILSTGSTLLPDSFDYVYEKIKRDVLLGSISGGTDIISSFCGSNPLSPVYRGEIMAPNLGMAVASFDHAANPVIDHKGDLVCTKPFPSQPIFFWNDNDGSRYKKAYFSVFQGVWHHGDFMIVNGRTNGILMLGRSDATLNPGGVRFGSAEIYNVIEQFSAVADSVVVGQKWQGDERVVLFLKMKTPETFSPELIAAIKQAIRSQLSPRHVPSVILEIGDIPYTINMKKVEVAVKQVIHGEVPQNLAALLNPQSLELYKNIPQLQE